MKNFLFTVIWMLSLSPFLMAQTAQDVWADMEHFVVEHSEEVVPNEIQRIKKLSLDAEAEGEDLATKEELRSMVRRSHWEKIFRENNRGRFLAAKAERKNQRNTDRSLLTLDPNPDLVKECALNIVVIVDQSGSIQGNEPANIRSGLDGFIDNLVGTGNTLTFVGMGNQFGGAIHSSTVTYNPGSTASHHNWINNVLTFNGNEDSWSSGLSEAAAFDPDLVLMITDGNDTHGTNEANLTIAAADDLKNNGANEGNGAHIFVFGQDPGDYEGNLTLQNAVATLIAPNPIGANGPPSFNDVSTSDFIGFDGDEFHDLEDWLSTLAVCCTDLEITYISNRNCIRNDFRISGIYGVCPPNTITSLVLRFFRNGILQLTVPATVNNDNTWTFGATLSDMLDLGLMGDTWYDVVPVMTLSDGTVIVGDSYQAGTNNDLYFGSLAEPTALLNSSATNTTISKTRFCTDEAIYYHGSEDPIGSNHYSAIRRRPIGSSQDFDEYAQVGWVGTSLDGYTGDLRDQYPDYFIAGYEYRLYLSSHNPAECIAWKTTTIDFEVINCCEAEYELIGYPGCVEEGEPFTVVVRVKLSIDQVNIENAYSYDNLYTLVSYNAAQAGEYTEIYLQFVTDNCTCTGNILTLDIVLEGCSAPIWVMTPPLPCCTEECDFIETQDWEAGDCFLYNDQLARPFSIVVQSPTSIFNAYAAVNGATCQTTLVDLTVTPGPLSTYTISGTMLFDDPACDGHALISLILETKYKCCLIEQAFSFPKRCRLPEICLLPVQPELINVGELISVLSVSMDLPTGTLVNVTDHVNGWALNLPIQTITCGPFWLGQNGELQGGSPCNGFNVSLFNQYNCDDPIEGQNTNYHFTIEYEGCTWVLTGDLCDIATNGRPVDKAKGGKSEERNSTPQHSMTATSNSIEVYPNPLNNSATLNFDLTKLSLGVQSIRITDINGQLLERITPPANKVFSHDLTRKLSQGVYLIVFQLEDGSLSTKKLIAME